MKTKFIESDDKLGLSKQDNPGQKNFHFRKKDPVWVDFIFRLALPSSLSLCRFTTVMIKCTRIKGIKNLTNYTL